MMSLKSWDAVNVLVISVLIPIVFVLYRCATMLCDCPSTKEHYPTESTRGPSTFTPGPAPTFTPAPLPTRGPP